MKLPLEYRWLKAQKFNGFIPRHFRDPDVMESIRKEYILESGHDLIPFAQRQDRDDIAGFAISKGKVSSEVLTVHLTWSGKREIGEFPLTRTTENIFEWIKIVLIPSTMEYMNEDDLSTLLKN